MRNKEKLSDVFTVDEMILLERSLRVYIRDVVSKDPEKSIYKRLRLAMDLIEGIASVETKSDFDIFS